MGREKTIYCPRCKHKVAHYDGKSQINIIANCKKCKKRIVYHVDTDKVELKNIPKRPCSSGMTFY